jgi:metal-responsive CopG/Arc/MetJ family transcriptional regulator
MPDDLLEQIDAEAARRGISRSAFVVLALRRELTRREPEAIDAAVARSVERFRT